MRVKRAENFIVLDDLLSEALGKEQMLKKQSLRDAVLIPFHAVACGK